MTSPYVYPVGGFGCSLAPAMSRVVEDNGGACVVDGSIDAMLVDDGGSVCGVQANGVKIDADCVVAAPEYAPEVARQKYHVRPIASCMPHAVGDVRTCMLLSCDAGGSFICRTCACTKLVQGLNFLSAHLTSSPGWPKFRCIHGIAWTRTWCGSKGEMARCRVGAGGRQFG